MIDNIHLETMPYIDQIPLRGSVHIHSR